MLTNPWCPVRVFHLGVSSEGPTGSCLTGRKSDHPGEVTNRLGSVADQLRPAGDQKPVISPDQVRDPPEAGHVFYFSTKELLFCKRMQSLRIPGRAYRKHSTVGWPAGNAKLPMPSFREEPAIFR